VPVVALSDDRALTSADVPWIFRLPAVTAPAQALRMVMAAAACSSPSNIRDILASGKPILGVAFEPGGEPRSSASAARQ